MLSKTPANLNIEIDLLVPYARLLVAVSGGGDSIALLHILVEQLGKERLMVATVDHGLRAEAALEAGQVAVLCKQLGIPHKTLTWRKYAPDAGNAFKASARQAREGRYELLVRHARSVGAEAVVLGHTLDDQAETVVMRALRMNDASGTRGLAGMAAISNYNNIKLLRPMLNIMRSDLRAYLRNLNEDWVDDPSNEDAKYERVRVRRFLQNPSPLPAMVDIARLAQLSARSRHWLNGQVAEAVAARVVRVTADCIEIRSKPSLPRPVLKQLLCSLLQTAGGLCFPVAERKIEDVVDAVFAEKSFRKSVGKCLIDVQGSTVTLRPEQRGTAYVAEFAGLKAQSFETIIQNIFQPGYDEALTGAIQKCFLRPQST